MAVKSAILVGWTRAQPGRETTSVSKFKDFVGYLGQLQAEKRIESFEPILLEPHGGDLNGFVVIRGDRPRLNELRENDKWKEWVAFGAVHLQGFGVIDCHLGDEITEHMERFRKAAAG